MNESASIDHSSSVNAPQAAHLTATCPLCDKRDAPRVFTSRDRIHHRPGEFAIHHCAHCHAYFIQPWLSAAQLADYYPEEYGRYRAATSLDKKNYHAYWQRFVLEHRYGYPMAKGRYPSIFKSAAARLLSLFTARGVIPYRGQGRILDVGCGGGSFLYRLKQWGWDAYGIEPSAAGVKQALGLGLNVRQGMLPDGQFASGFFDVVRLSNVLEHLSDPRGTFEEIRRILKPDGVVYITVPNTRSLVFWLFQEYWYALDAPRHVISYSPKTLRVLCDAAGFEIASMNFAAGPFNCVRSLSYLFEQNGNRWPGWIRAIRWEHSKAVRRLLKPFFFVVDRFGYGDFLHAILRQKSGPSSASKGTLT